MRKYINNHTYIFLIVFFIVSIVIYQKKTEPSQVPINKLENLVIEEPIMLEAQQPTSNINTKRHEISSIANTLTAENENVDSFSKKEKKVINVTDNFQEKVVNPASVFIRLGKKYSDQLPKLVSVEMAGNYVDVNSTFNLLQRSTNGDLDAKSRYEEILNDLKIHADAGDVRAQQDYAMFLSLNVHYPNAYPDIKQRTSYSETSKENYIRAIISGQAQSAVNISNDSILGIKKDPVEALAWGFIAKKMGARSAESVVCVDNNVTCTEEMFANALKDAKFYIDFYEFKLDK